jgi:acid phosphatase family membrane protein YuiD
MKAILSIVIAWLVAQALKTLTSRKISALWKPGGMPSSHSALVGALATAVGLETGFTSIQAAIAYVVAFIVIYDTFYVRKRHNMVQIIVGLLVGIITVALVNYL